MMRRRKRTSTDDSVTALSVNGDDSNASIPTTKVNRSGNNQKCSAEGVATAVQKKGTRTPEMESFERFLPANNDVTQNCNKRTKKNGNPPAALKPKKRRFSSGRHFGNCHSGKLVDAEDIINNHKVGSKDNDPDPAQDTGSVSASLANLSDEIVTGCSKSAGNEEQNGIRTADKGRKKAVQRRSCIGIRVRKDRLDKRSNDPKLKDYQRLHAVASSLELDNMGTSSTDIASSLSQPKRKEFKSSFVLPSLDDDDCTQSDDGSQHNNHADESIAQSIRFSSIRSKDSLSLNVEKRSWRRKSETTIAKENKPSTGLSVESQHLVNKSSLKSIPLSATRNNFVSEGDDVVLSELHTTVNTAGNSGNF